MTYDFFKLSLTELAIMQILWEEQRLMSAADIAERLNGHSRATAAELLRRLAAKSAVLSLTIDGKAMYFYNIDDQIYKAMLLKNLAESLFGGDRAELVHLLLSDMDITSGELDEVKAAVERAEDVAKLIARKEAEKAEEECAEAGTGSAEPAVCAEDGIKDGFKKEAAEYAVVIDLARYKKERRFREGKALGARRRTRLPVLLSETRKRGLAFNYASCFGSGDNNSALLMCIPYDILGYT